MRRATWLTWPPGWAETERGPLLCSSEGLWDRGDSVPHRRVNGCSESVPIDEADTPGCVAEKPPLADGIGSRATTIEPSETWRFQMQTLTENQRDRRQGWAARHLSGGYDQAVRCSGRGGRPEHRGARGGGGRIRRTERRWEVDHHSVSCSGWSGPRPATASSPLTAGTSRPRADGAPHVGPARGRRVMSVRLASSREPSIR
jgi:hypothetical protein